MTRGDVAMWLIAMVVFVIIDCTLYWRALDRIGYKFGEGFQPPWRWWLKWVLGSGFYLYFATGGRMNKFIAGLILGVVVGVCISYHAHAQTADQEWSAANVQAGEPSKADQLEPPAGSFGFHGCGQWAVWVFLKNGKSYRYDSEATPKTEVDIKALFDWLNTGPTDIYVPTKCGVSI